MFKDLDTLTPASRVLKIFVFILVSALISVLMVILIRFDSHAPGLKAAAMAQLPNSGVENPVTAVLLNYRAYDTLLEIAVLFIAVMTIVQLGKQTTQPPSPDFVPKKKDFILKGLAGIFVPLTVLVGAYLLWLGSYAPGGAFQAGALWAGAGVLSFLAGRPKFAFGSLFGKLILIFGLATFLVVAVGVALKTGGVLQFPPNFAGSYILAIEVAATISIAATLLLLYENLAPTKLGGLEHKGDPSP